MTVPAAIAVIAEDEPLLAAHLRAELARCWPALEVAACVVDGEAAVAAVLAQRPQVCFFDIRMPVMSGLEAAAAIAEDWPAAEAFPLIVFVTAYDQHALAAFEAQAADYLVKPVEAARLERCVARLQARLAERAGAVPAGTPSPGPELDRVLATLRALLPAEAAPAPAATAPLAVVPVQAGATVTFVPVEDIVYFEAADKYLRVLTPTREHLIRLSLKELLPQLDPQRFWQVHRGLVVQVRDIAMARREDSGQVTLTLARRPEKLTASRLHAHRFKGW
jgi:DNA-binding LytR/AlgR family response regulator